MSRETGRLVNVLSANCRELGDAEVERIAMLRIMSGRLDKTAMCRTESGESIYVCLPRIFVH